MKPLLLGDRADRAIPAHSSLASRFGAWARESLVARAIAIAAGLLLLAAIGGSALAGNLAAKAAIKEAPEPSASPPVVPGAPIGQPHVVDAVDAGTVAVTRTEPPPETPGGTSAPASRATPDDPVELNSAHVEDLRRLPGVGEKRAEAILALRARLPGGRFRQLEDLLKVKGIGRAMLKRLHPLVRLNP